MLKLFKTISVYSFGNILSVLVSFLLLPVYTRLLTPGDYGVLELTNLFAAVIGLLFGLNVSSGYARIYFDNKDVDARKKLFATGQFFTLMTALLISVFIIFNTDWFSSIIFNSNVSSQFLVLITASTIFSILTRIPMSNLQIRQLPKQYITVSLLGVMLTVISTIVFVVIYR
jgi:O-antigen/teichoic acid export membrane protein